MLDERLRVLEKHIGKEPPASDPNDRIRRAYAEAYFRAVVEFLQNDNLEHAETYLHRAAVLFPELIQQRDSQWGLFAGVFDYCCRPLCQRPIFRCPSISHPQRADLRQRRHQSPTSQHVCQIAARSKTCQSATSPPFSRQLTQ